MPKYELTQESRELLLKDQELQGKVAKAITRTVQTVIRLVKVNDHILTTVSVLEILAEHTGEDKTNSFLQELQVTV